MDVDQLAQRLGLQRRQVRYAIDQRLVPGIEHVCQGRGVARDLTVDEAFAVACSAVLHAAGLRPTVVRDCLTRLGRRWPGLLGPTVQPALATDAAPLLLEIDDGHPFQVAETLPAVGDKAEVAGGGGRALVQTRLDLAALRRRLLP